MNKDVTYWNLRNHNLFASMSNEQVSDLCIITRYKTAVKGEIIYFAEENVQRVYLLKIGMIKIVEVTESGEEVIKEIIQKGDLFGEIALNTNSNTHEYAQAMSPEVAICSFKLHDFEEMLKKDATIGLKYNKLIGVKYLKLQNQYTNLVFKDVRTRLIDFIKDWNTREGKNLGGQWVIENYLTHSDIASLICSTRQTVNQLINELEANNRLKYSRKEIVIPVLENLI